MFDNLRHTLDFDDLLFEKRNRAYGAYQLRKKYNAVIIAGIIVASLLVSSVVVIPFLLSGNSDQVVRGGGNFVQVSMDALQPPPEDVYIPPSPPPPEAEKIQEIVKYIPPVVVDSVLSNQNTTPTNDEVLASDDGDKKDSFTSGSGDDMSIGQDGSETDDPFYVVEVMPTFKGGDLAKFQEWVGKRTNYPQAAYDNKIRGTVFLTFIVEKDGTVSSVTIVKGVHPLLDNEAVRVISESPKWAPGYQRGQPVRVRFSIPLNFMF
jgi:periplasmic protein TonB